MQFMLNTSPKFSPKSSPWIQSRVQVLYLSVSATHVCTDCLRTYSRNCADIYAHMPAQNLHIPHTHNCACNSKTFRMYYIYIYLHVQWTLWKQTTSVEWTNCFTPNQLNLACITCTCIYMYIHVPLRERPCISIMHKLLLPPLWLRGLTIFQIPSDERWKECAASPVSPFYTSESYVLQHTYVCIY